MFGINSVGRRTGEAIVVLETPEQAGLALQRHRHYLNQRYVEVSVATPTFMWWMLLLFSFPRKLRYFSICSYECNCSRMGVCWDFHLPPSPPPISEKVLL